MVHQSISDRFITHQNHGLLRAQVHGHHGPVAFTKLEVTQTVRSFQSMKITRIDRADKKMNIIKKDVLTFNNVLNGVFLSICNNLPKAGKPGGPGG